MMPIDEALRACMAREGWSFAKVAATAGVAEPTARRWARGERAMSGPGLMALRRELPGFADLLDGKAVA